MGFRTTAWKLFVTYEDHVEKYNELLGAAEEIIESCEDLVGQELDEFGDQMDELCEMTKKLQVAASDSDKFWVEYMTFFWKGDKYIPQSVRTLIVAYSSPAIDIKQLEFVIGRYWELRQYIGYWTSDGKYYAQLQP